MSTTIRLRRGTFTNLPNSGLAAGEPLWTSDRGTLHVAEDATTHIPVVPAIDELNNLPSPEGTDLLIVHDGSETSGQKEKRITFSNFKNALNIPDSSTDEKVATSDGQEADFLSEVLVDDGSSIDITESSGVMTVSVPTGGIDSAHLAAGAVTSAEIDDGAVTSVKLASGAVITAKIADGAVTSAKLDDEAVTNSKLDPAALDLSTTNFAGNGITTTLEIAEIDGGSF